MKLFGASNISAHTYALAISVSLLIILYSLAKKLFGASVALTTALIVMAQPMFMTQSAMLYPEMLMALGLIVALSGYLQNKTWLYYIGMFIAIYSKESALVFFVAFLGWDVVRVLTRESASKTLVKHAWPALFFSFPSPAAIPLSRMVFVSRAYRSSNLRNEGCSFQRSQDLSHIV